MTTDARDAGAPPVERRVMALVPQRANGHGLMTADDGGQRCPTCGFWTNVRAELEPQ